MVAIVHDTQSAEAVASSYGTAADLEGAVPHTLAEGSATIARELGIATAVERTMKPGGCEPFSESLSPCRKGFPDRLL